jgi:prophage regulatory protein
MTDLTSPLPAPAPADRFVSWPEVRLITGLSRTTIWRLQKTGEFPKAVRISPGRIAWRASEVTAWLNPGFADGASAELGGEAALRTAPTAGALAQTARPPQLEEGRPRRRTRGEVAQGKSQLTLGF